MLGCNQDRRKSCLLNKYQHARRKQKNHSQQGRQRPGTQKDQADWRNPVSARKVDKKKDRQGEPGGEEGRGDGGRTEQSVDRRKKQVLCGKGEEPGRRSSWRRHDIIAARGAARDGGLWHTQQTPTLDASWLPPVANGGAKRPKQR